MILAEGGIVDFNQLKNYRNNGCCIIPIDLFKGKEDNRLNVIGADKCQINFETIISLKNFRGDG
jgi:hypothetical protein